MAENIEEESSTATSSNDRRIRYTIHSSSGHTATFKPEYILTDNPQDQSSRWTGATSKQLVDQQQAAAAAAAAASAASSSGQTARQRPIRPPPAKRRKRDVLYLVLELEQPALVDAIGFGKYQKSHPCNLYEFSIYGGMSPDVAYMQPLHHGSLKNDTVAEVVPLPTDVATQGRGSVLFPVKYIRIDAYSAHTQNYNVSIWHVWLEGTTAPDQVDPAIEAYAAYQSTHTSHLILSHLRRTPSQLPAFATLASSLPPQTLTSFEHPLLTELHTELVLQDRFGRVEQLLGEILEAGLLREWTRGGGKGKSVARWTLIHASSPSPSASSSKTSTTSSHETRQPRGRGGHQVVRIGRRLLLFGGWDGERDLGDLWEYELPRAASSTSAGDRDIEAENDVGGGWRCLLSDDDGVGSQGLGGRMADGGGPRPQARSCHQLAVDEREGWVYLLGAKRSASTNTNASTNTQLGTPPPVSLSAGATVQREAHDTFSERVRIGAAVAEGDGGSGENGNAPTTTAAAEPRRPPRRGERMPTTASATEAAGARSDSADSGAMDVEAGPSTSAATATAAPTTSQSAITTSAASAATQRSTNGSSGVSKSDLWRYKAVGPGRGTWELLSQDTAAEKGPKLLFDHQMFVHSEMQKLFVFGGRNQPPETGDEPDGRHSGMYCYDIATRTWSHLFGDPTSQDQFRSERLLSRFGHSMLFDAATSTIYIFSGQRGDSYLSDLWAIQLASADKGGSGDESDEDDDAEHKPSADVRSSRLWRQGAVVDLPSCPASTTASRPPTILQIRQLTSDYSAPAGTSLQPDLNSTILADGSSSTPPTGPPAAFTQRASLDPHTHEWTLLTGLVRDRRANKEVPSDDIWVRSPPPPPPPPSSSNGSTTVPEEAGAGTWELVEQRQPRPPSRYAAQVVFDPLRGEHYLFGGNPAQSGQEPRLGDLWRLKIVRPSPEEALRQAKFLVRKQRFTEMCQTRPTLIALDYLQNDLASVVDHTDAVESAAFRSCMAALLSAPARNNCDVNMADGEAAAGGAGSEDDDDDEDGDDDGASAEKDPELYKARQTLFEQLLDFVPDGERQPKELLSDLAMTMRG